jgi:hypothetical protein
LIRSSGFVDQIFCQCARGNDVKASTSVFAASMSGPILGNREASCSRTSSQVGELLADFLPGCGDGLCVGLSEDRAKHGRDHVGVRPRHRREQVAGEVQPAALMIGSLEAAAERGDEARPSR